MSVELLVFGILASLVLLASAGVILARNPVTAAVWLVVDLFFLAAVYASLGADFIAAIQVIVYAGAIVVLFLFVIMLLNLVPGIRPKSGTLLPEIFVALATLFAFLLVAWQIVAVTAETGKAPLTQELLQASGGHTYSVGMALFTKFSWPFELASILILLATIGAIVIAKKQKANAN